MQRVVTLILAVGWATSALAASRTPYSSFDAEMPAALAGPSMEAVDIYKRTAPSIYLIVAAKNDETMKRGKSVYEGSAVAITPTLALTNCHIVKGRKTLVLEQNKKMDLGTVVASDPKTDRCVIEAQTMKLHPISGVRRYGDIEVGEKVYTIGNPSGLESTLGEGIVSGLRGDGGVRYVQTSAPISPGSSGGGLFDAHGNLLGITTFKIGDAENLNFAIAAEDYWGKVKKRRRHKDKAE